MTRRDYMSRVAMAASLALALGGAVAGCGGGHGAVDGDGSPDSCGGALAVPAAGDGGAMSCWPVDSSTPGGTIELGTGRNGFEPLPDSLQFIDGGQGGTLLVLNARIEGLEPGNPDCFLDPQNPRTRFTVTLQDGTQVGGGCPSTVGYKPSGSGAGYDERAQAELVPFLPYEVGEKAFNTNVDIKVEIIDANGHYASDDRTVFAKAPAGYTDAGP